MASASGNVEAPNGNDDTHDEDGDNPQRFAEAVGDEYGADVYFYSGAIGDVGLGLITTAITRGKTRNKALMILTTNGGTANAAYQIARLFQKNIRRIYYFHAELL